MVDTPIKKSLCEAVQQYELAKLNKRNQMKNVVNTPMKKEISTVVQHRQLANEGKNIGKPLNTPLRKKIKRKAQEVMSKRIINQKINSISTPMKKDILQHAQQHAKRQVDQIPKALPTPLRSDIFDAAEDMDIRKQNLKPTKRMHSAIKKELEQSIKMERKNVSNNNIKLNTPLQKAIKISAELRRQKDQNLNVNPVMTSAIKKEIKAKVSFLTKNIFINFDKFSLIVY